MNRKRLLLAGAMLVGLLVFTVISGPPWETMVLAAASHEGAHTPASDPLSFDWMKRDMALWTLVIFLILFAILAKYAFKPIADALDAREKSVADNIASAEAANLDAKNSLKLYQQKLDDAKDEVRGILDTARKDAQRNAEGIIEKAKEAAQLEAQRAQKDIEAQTDLALQQLAEQSATLATSLAGKMIRAEIKPENHRDLIQTALTEFAKN